MIVTDSSGCSGQSSVRISVINDVDFYIPNAFTPNADGINDFFTVFSESGLVRVQQLLIFDRWGEKIYERTDFPTNDMSLGWDGRFRGQLMNPGVFVYLAEIEFIDGSLETVSGSVTLVR
ncbi:MAG: T9SS type B sorting domain-containing protein [Bacteroidetes bacterium]|nr:T9SS type B sorting domain-containing protein [Bacteroidota bacterium]